MPKSYSNLRDDIFNTLSEVNDHDARELHVYADNHADLHRQRTTPVHKNLRNKMADGKYDHEKAKKAFKHVTDDAAKRYKSEHGHHFDVATRKHVASKMADRFHDEAKSGEHDHHLHKKHQKKKNESVEANEAKLKYSKDMPDKSGHVTARMAMRSKGIQGTIRDNGTIHVAQRDVKATNDILKKKGVKGFRATNEVRLSEPKPNPNFPDIDFDEYEGMRGKKKVAAKVKPTQKARPIRVKLKKAVHAAESVEQVDEKVMGAVHPGGSPTRKFSVPASPEIKKHIESGKAKILVDVQSVLGPTTRFVVIPNPEYRNAKISGEDKVLMATISDPKRGKIKMFAFHGSHVSHQKAMQFAKNNKLVTKEDAKGNPLYAKESVELDEKFDLARRALVDAGIPHMGERKTNKLKVHPKFKSKAQDAMKKFKGVDLEINHRMPEKPMTREEIEQVDELDAKTLIRYHDKASAQVTTDMKTDRGRVTPKTNKRFKGVLKARKKLDKIMPGLRQEGTDELDEQTPLERRADAEHREAEAAKTDVDRERKRKRARTALRTYRRERRRSAELGEETNLDEAKGTYTVVALLRNKVVGQIHSIEKKEIKDAVSMMKASYKGAKISVEDPRGKVVQTESTELDEKLTTPEKHQVHIAKKTLNTPDAAVRWMGGMTKDDARKILKKHKVRFKESVEEGQIECPKCEGEGCSHCDGKGYHSKRVKESVESLDEMPFVFPDDRKAKQFDLDIGNSGIGVGDRVGNKVTLSKVDSKWHPTVKKYVKKNKGKSVKESTELDEGVEWKKPEPAYLHKKRKDGTYSVLKNHPKGAIGMSHDHTKAQADRLVAKHNKSAEARSRRDVGLPALKGKLKGQRLFP